MTTFLQLFDWIHQIMVIENVFFPFKYRLYRLDLTSLDMQNMINGSLFGRYIKPMMSGNQVQSEMQNE